jgi:hypothetical protein
VFKSAELGVLNKSSVSRVVGKVNPLTVPGSFALKLVSLLGRVRVIRLGVTVTKSVERVVIAVVARLSVIRLFVGKVQDERSLTVDPMVSVVRFVRLDSFVFASAEVGVLDKSRVIRVIGRANP